MLNPGDKAPAFNLESDAGTKISLASLKGKKVVLYFYPKDDTPGCTIQACEYRDTSRQYKSEDTVVLGVSRDDLESHKAFKKKFKLNFPLLSDPDHKTHEKYGAWGEKNMYGKKSMGVIRTTVVIDEQGKVLSWAGQVKAEGDADRALTIVKEG
jgi:thioredoxin-dependent peroxiredoxin